MYRQALDTQRFGHLQAQGVTVSGSVRTPTDADRLRSEFGPKFLPLVFDVRDTAAIQQAASEVEERLAGSRLAGLVNNAGMAIVGPSSHTPVDYPGTPYQAQLERFAGQAMKEAETGFQPGKVAELIWRALTSPRPRARYAIVPRPWIEWILPRMIPTSWLDEGMRRYFGFPAPGAGKPEVSSQNSEGDAPRKVLEILKPSAFWLLTADFRPFGRQCSAARSEECWYCQLKSPEYCVWTEQPERPRSAPKSSPRASLTEPVEN